MSSFPLRSTFCFLCWGLAAQLVAAEPTQAKPAGLSHWAYQPIRLPVVPAAGVSEIDAFIGAKLAERGLEPSPAADRVTLIRRLSFDLIGLPPSPEEIKSFVEDASIKAYETLVERLLASPQYGERWGRHWLDVARYAESDGFEYDRLRPNAWGYRDYVIKSFNEDKPYDRFMQEQVAGDVMAPVTEDGIVAPSLLVCGPWDAAGAIQANVTQRSIAREDEMEDLVSVVGQSFLGLTVNCARCHDHKSDPIPQVDYYRIKCVFDGVKHGERPILGDAEKQKQQEALTQLDQSLGRARQQITEIETLGAQRLANEHPDKPQEIPPVALARWSFNGAPMPMKGELKGGAKFEADRLQLGKSGAYYQTENFPQEIREKTLEAWVSLGSLEQRGGGVISLEGEGGVFDGIVFGERQPKRWMAGSNSFVRTVDQPLPEETATLGSFVQVAIVYRSDNSIQLYRNGAALGPAYTPKAPLQTFPAGTAHVLLGLRHHGASNGFFTGELQQAALYDRALSAEEIARSFRAGSGAPPLAELLAKLTAAEHAAHAAALAELKRLEASRAELGSQQARVSYVGTRVEPAVTKLLKRGEVTSPAEVVTPGGLVRGNDPGLRLWSASRGARGRSQAEICRLASRSQEPSASTRHG